MNKTVLMVWVILKVMTLVKRSEGHGYLSEPPSRSSMWRWGLPNPINYNDNGVRCAMYTTECRVCGDKDNEAGGRYANGIIVRNYVEGQVIDIFVHLTFTHLGYFEIHLCPHNDPTTPVTEDCLLEHTLMLEDGSTRYQIDPKTVGKNQSIKFKVILPENVTCTQCVLRWYYRVGNNWGKDPVTGEVGLGFGPQERFFGCADVSISAASTSGSITSTTRSSPATTTTAATTRMPSGGKTTCRAINEWEGNEVFDALCIYSCDQYCPITVCSCD